MGCTYTSAAQASPLAVEASVARTESRTRPVALRDDDDITTLQLNVLFEILPGADLSVMEVQHSLSARGVADDDDAVQFRVRVTAADHAQRLQHIHGRVHDDRPGLVHLADDIRYVALH